MRDTSLVILAGCRPLYLSQCLQSWAEARGADSLHSVVIRLARSNWATELDMKQTAEDAAHWYGLPVRVVLDDPEDAQFKGPDRALGKQINLCFEDPLCEFVIECDEDVLVSDDILEYFSWARSLNAAAVCAHNDLGQGWSSQWDDTDADQSAVQLRPEFTSWCFGITSGAWQRIWLPQWDWTRSAGPDQNQHGFEWQMHRQANAGLLLAVPDASRCQNIGEHGGTFSLPHMFDGTQARSFRQHRDPVSYRLR